MIAWCRNPGVARTAKEAKDLLDKWKMGRKRLMVVLQAADLSPIEREEALMHMVCGVVHQDDGVRYRYQQVVWGKANQSPTEEDVMKLQLFLEKELYNMEINDDVRNSSGVRNGGLGTNPWQAGAGSGVSKLDTAQEDKQTRICFDWEATCTCKFGADCRYVHST